MKSARQEEILNIIREQSPQTQEQLLLELRRRGFSATQATISRDVRQLGLVKEPDPRGGFHFTKPERRLPHILEQDEGMDDQALRLRKIFREGVLSVSAAQNLLVIKTMPGLAPAACSALDGMRIPGLVGTLAGDDTGLLILKDSARALSFREEVDALLK